MMSEKQEGRPRSPKDFRPILSGRAEGTLHHMMVGRVMRTRIMSLMGMAEY